MKFISLVLTSVLFIGLPAFSQESQPQDSLLPDNQERVLEAIENLDIGFLWSGGLSQDNRIGYISDNYSRLEVRFISVIRNFDNPYEYFIYGKTRVSGSVCEFQGSLQIAEITIAENDKDSGLTPALLAGDYVLFEDESCLHSGMFRGQFFTQVYMDESGSIFYHDLSREDKGFVNNEFTGDWENYDTAELKPANWGDFRIPNSGPLDVGSDVFQPSFRFRENGWEGYAEEREAIREGSEPENWWRN